MCNAEISPRPKRGAAEKVIFPGGGARVVGVAGSGSTSWPTVIAVMVQIHIGVEDKIQDHIVQDYMVQDHLIQDHMDHVVNDRMAKDHMARIHIV